MKIVDVDQLKHPGITGPFYAVIDREKLDSSDSRACGCASLALLNTVLFLKNKIGIRNGKTPFDEMMRIKRTTSEENNLVQPEAMLNFISRDSIFDSCRMLVMNPNAMDEVVFLRIFLRRLMDGNVALVMMELPGPNEAPKNRINHASFIHCEDGEVYFDGLLVNLDFLIRAFYFSKPTTLLFFAINRGESNEE